MLTKSNTFKSAQVWSQTNCPACSEAKALLERSGIAYSECMIGINGYTKKDLIDKVPAARSVPQIFVDGEYVGGLLELKKLLNDNNQRTKMV
jgi:glutaredoxin 3